MTLTAFQDFADALAQANDLPLDVAKRYAGLIGDTPELDAQGLAVVTDRDGEVLAHLQLPSED